MKQRYNRKVLIALVAFFLSVGNLFAGWPVTATEELTQIEECVKEDRRKLGAFDRLRRAFLYRKLKKPFRASALYQRVVDLFPRTEASKIAKMSLIRSGGVGHLTEQKAADYLRGEDEAHAVYAIVVNKFPSKKEDQGRKGGSSAHQLSIIGNL